MLVLLTPTFYCWCCWPQPSTVGAVDPKICFGPTSHLGFCLPQKVMGASLYFWQTWCSWPTKNGAGQPPTCGAPYVPSKNMMGCPPGEPEGVPKWCYRSTSSLFPWFPSSHFPLLLIQPHVRGLGSLRGPFRHHHRSPPPWSTGCPCSWGWWRTSWCRWSGQLGRCSPGKKKCEWHHQKRDEEVWMGPWHV